LPFKVSRKRDRDLRQFSGRSRRDTTPTWSRSRNWAYEAPEMVSTRHAVKKRVMIVDDAAMVVGGDELKRAKRSGGGRKGRGCGSTS
jgi:hypothetical protein